MTMGPETASVWKTGGVVTARMFVSKANTLDSGRGYGYVPDTIKCLVCSPATATSFSTRVLVVVLQAIIHKYEWRVYGRISKQGTAREQHDIRSLRQRSKRGWSTTIIIYHDQG